MRRMAAAAVVVLAALAVPSSAAAELLVSGDGLWLISDDGASRTAAPGDGEDASWSPDGERFVMTVRGPREDVPSTLVVVHAGTGERTVLPGSEDLDEPAWSPDGQSIAAARELPRKRNDDGPLRNELVVLPAGGGTPRTVTSGFYDVGPAWSPSGLELAFARVNFDLRRGTVDRKLMAVRADGSGLRQVAGDGGDPSWSPDGRSLVFSSVRDRNGEKCFHECAPNGELYLAPADGSGGERRLTDTKADEDDPAWSPDGARIAFASDRHYPDGRFPEVWVMDADGTCATQLTFGSDHVSEPAWRPGRLPVGRGPCGQRLAPYHDGADLASVRVPNATPLYPGRAFEGMLLSDAEDNLIILDECELPDPERCHGEIQLQTYPICRRNPTIFDVPTRSVYRMRGALVADYGEGYDLMSGGTTTAVFGVTRRAVLRRVVAALRPTSGPENLDRPLPRPQLPPSAWRALRRSKQLRKGESIIGSPRAMVRSDRRVLRALRRARAGHRPACND